MAKSRGQHAGLMAVGAAIVLSVGGVWAGQESAGQARATAAASLRAHGLQLGYNLDHTDALAAFKDATAADPSDPAAYRLAAATAWIDLLFEQGAITADDYLGQARATLARATPTAISAVQYPLGLGILSFLVDDEGTEAKRYAKEMKASG